MYQILCVIVNSIIQDKYKNDIFLLLVISLIIISVYYLSMKLNYNNMTKYRFIHPTKSGGTAVERYFKQYYSNNICGQGHGDTCKNNNNPIIIVRDVKTRFYSMYKYWKNGAIDTNYKRNEAWIYKYNDTTVFDFIRMLKSKDRQLYQGFTWKQHFDTTVKWIHPSCKYKNIIIIRYEENLNVKIQKLINKLGIKNKNIPVPVVNVSKNTNCEYDIENKIVNEFIHEYFKDDIELIHKINTQPELFKFVI